MSLRPVGKRVALQAQTKGDKGPPAPWPPRPSFSRVPPSCQPPAQTHALLTQAGNQPEQFRFLVPIQPPGLPGWQDLPLPFLLFPFGTQVCGLSVWALPGTMGVQAEGDGGSGRGEACEGLFVSEKPQLVTVLALGRGPGCRARDSGWVASLGLRCLDKGSSHSPQAPDFSTEGGDLC